MGKFIYMIGLWLCTLSLAAQGTWKSYLSYYETTAVAEGNDYVYAVASGSLLRYGKEDNSVKFYTREDGLSDVNIGQIAYNPATNTLLIVYTGGSSEGNIDLLGESGIYNLPYLKDNSMIQDKTVNSIAFREEYAYLSTRFGILVINMAKREFADTYRFEQQVFSTCIKGSTLYAATAEGLRKASLSDNLLDQQNWQEVPLATDKFSASEVSQIALFQDHVCLCVAGKGIYYLADDNTVRPLVEDSYTKKFTLQNGKLIGLTTTIARIWSNLSEYNHLDLSKTGLKQVRDIASLNGTDKYWVAAYTDGLVGIKVKGYNSAEVTVSGLVLPDEAPKRNLADHLLFANKRLYVVGGGRWTDRYGNPGTLMVHEGGKWFNFNEAEVFASDYMDVAVDPLDPSHYFVASYGEGLLEFKDDKFVTKYTFDNSTLETIFPGQSVDRSYIRVAGLAFDKSGNLWMNNAGVERALHVRKADGSWQAMPYDVLSNTGMPDKILVTSWGDKWMNIPHASHLGIFAFNEGDLSDSGDDVYHLYTSFQTRDGSTVNVGAYYCLAEDLQGNIWIGTDRGPVVCPAAAARYAAKDESRVYASQLVRDEAGELSYFLDGERVNAIAVDGGDRKWIGTESSGVFLVNADGSETLENFTTANSPLLSNKINAISIDNETGEVFIGTDKGLISYMGGATEGKDSYSDVYAYPNPVRPEHADRVTITGLMGDSNVKITDLAGNLVYQGKSTGGQLTWNCRRNGGGRVATGVYLVFAATPEGKESVVTKIMVIR